MNFKTGIFTHALLFLCSAGGIGSFSVPALAAPGDPLSAPTPIIDQPLPNSWPSSAEVTVDQGGQVVIGWDRGQHPGTIAVRRFAADFQPASASSVVDASSFDPYTYDGADNGVAVATNASGRTVVAYTTRLEYAGIAQSVFFRRYGRDGVPLGESIEVAVQNPVRHPGLIEQFPRFPVSRHGSHAAVAINAAGEFVVAWAEEESLGTFYLPSGAQLLNGSKVLARRYHSDGTPAGAVEVVARRGPQPLSPSNGLHAVVRVLATPDDRFAVIYSNGTVDGPVRDLRSPFSLRYVGPDGRPQGPARKLETRGDRGQATSESDFHAACTASGELLLSWVTEALRNDFNLPQQVWVRRYSLAGIPRSAPAQVAVREASFGSCCSVRVVPLASSALAVLWPDVTGERTVRTVNARFFASDLSPVGEPFVLVNGTTDASAVSDADGNLVVSYGTLETQPELRQLYLQRFQGP